jgi:hypothetical protein
MSFASFVTKLGDALSEGIHAVADSGIIPTVVGKTTRAGLNVGKTAGNIGFKAGMFGINSGLKGANYIKDHYDDIADAAKRFGKALGEEGKEFAHAGINAASLFDKTFLTEAPLDRSIFGRKFNKKGLALVAVGATAMQGGRDVKRYLDERTGTNDGQLYRPTPMMSTPYQLSEQMAYSSHGRSFADNAGATGDLVFALNNMRNG